MIHEPTQAPSLLEAPAADQRRLKFRAALALAGHIVSTAELPTHFTVECAPWDTDATVVAYAHHDIGLLHAWQRRFGGDLHHTLQDQPDGTRVYSSLKGEAFDGSFTLWTLRKLRHTPEESAAERELCARWVAEHDDPTGWSESVRAGYVAALEALRVAVAE